MEIRKQVLFITDHLLRSQEKLKKQTSGGADTRILGMKGSF